MASFTTCAHCGVRLMLDRHRPCPDLCDTCLDIVDPDRDRIYCTEGCGTEVNPDLAICGQPDCRVYAIADARGQI